jgi:hypothetical protein
VITQVSTVSNIEEAKVQLGNWMDEGYPQTSIYVLTHDEDRTDRIVDETETEKIGLIEEGLGSSVANLFRSHGDELRNKLKSLGVSKVDAEWLEAEMDRDMIVMIAWGGQLFDGEKHDPSIIYKSFQSQR